MDSDSNEHPAIVCSIVLFNASLIIIIIVITVVAAAIIIIIIIRYVYLLSQAFLPGASLELAVILSAQATSFSLQYLLLLLLLLLFKSAGA